MSPLSNFNHHPHITSTQMPPAGSSKSVKLIRGALYTSLLGALLTFALSLPVFLGFLSFFLTPVMTGLTLIFTITLLVFSTQNCNGTRPPAGKHHLPALCRKPTIIAAYAIAVGWLAAFGMLVYLQVDFYKFEPSKEEWRFKGLGIAEAVLAVSDARMFVLIGVLCMKERKEEMGRSGRESLGMEAVEHRGKQ